MEVKNQKKSKIKKPKIKRSSKSRTKSLSGELFGIEPYVTPENTYYACVSKDGYVIDSSWQTVISHTKDSEAKYKSFSSYKDATEWVKAYKDSTVESDNILGITNDQNIYIKRIEAECYPYAKNNVNDPFGCRIVINKRHIDDVVESVATLDYNCGDILDDIYPHTNFYNQRLDETTKYLCAILKVLQLTDKYYISRILVNNHKILKRLANREGKLLDLSPVRSYDGQSCFSDELFMKIMLDLPRMNRPPKIKRSRSASPRPVQLTHYNSLSDVANVFSITRKIKSEKRKTISGELSPRSDSLTKSEC